MRRGACPMRRGGRFFTLFQAKRGSSASAMARWTPNTTWRSSNTTWRGIFALHMGRASLLFKGTTNNASGFPNPKIEQSSLPEDCSVLSILCKHVIVAIEYLRLL